ncbi:MAG: hypothetical protein A2017_10875 [Lentisphaerae bacterium GWF2_44_16]|nr:MAG: hypothetical protein A2017_10875 [Lentisphaerae bacterium GWF2_44_16]
MTSIIDIAKKAKVSYSTVSRILRNQEGYSYSKTTSSRVHKIAQEMGYVPNMAARFIRTRKTKIIGITTQAENSYATYETTKKCSAAVRSYGYSPTMLDLSEYKSGDLSFLGNISYFAGVICSYKKHEKEIVELSEKFRLDIPVITMREGVTGNPNVREVKCDIRKGFETAFEYLLKLGHRNIAYIGHESASGRNIYYENMTKKHGIENKNFGVKEKAENNSFLSGVEMAARITADKNITAILSEDDEFAMGLISGLSDLGISVPRDISIIGFDNLAFSEAVRPRLTTVGVKRNERAEIGVKLLISLIEGSDVQKELLPQSITLDCELIIRESTGIAKSK